MIFYKLTFTNSSSIETIELIIFIPISETQKWICERAIFKLAIILVFSSKHANLNASVCNNAVNFLNFFINGTCNKHYFNILNKISIKNIQYSYFKTVFCLFFVK